MKLYLLIKINYDKYCYLFLLFFNLINTFRYSLNGKPGYPSGGSTMNSTRSISTNSDHYAIVHSPGIHSRPGSRYSGPGKNHHHHHRGPPSNIGSHYSAKLPTN